MENIHTVIIAFITGITGTASWQYWQRRMELKRETEYSYKLDCRYRIEKLEDELQKAYKDNEDLTKLVLELSVELASLKTRIELVEKKNS
jgi:predicted negative regulator of RcsB-dependent stress response